MNNRLSYLAATLVLGLVGCASLWGPKDNTPEPVEVPHFVESVHLKKSDLYSVDKAGPAIFSPAWINDQVFAVGADGEVAWSGLDKTEHKSLSFNRDPLSWYQKLWSARQQVLSAGVDANSEMMVAVTPKGVVLALGLDDKLRWQQAIGAEVITRPRLVGDSVLIRAQDGRLLALSALNGEIRWQSEVKNPPLSLHVPTGLAVVDNVVYAAFPGGKLRAYDLAKGNLLWENWVAQPKGASDLERVTDVVGDPWLDGNQVCAVSYQGKVACFERFKGEQIWAREFSSVTGLDGDHRYVYATDATSVVFAFDKMTGRQIWKQDKLYARRLTRPTVFGKYIALADFEGKVFLLDSETGDLVAQADVDDEVRAPLLVANERLIVQTLDGDVLTLRLQ